MTPEQLAGSTENDRCAFAQTQPEKLLAMVLADVEEAAYLCALAEALGHVPARYQREALQGLVHFSLHQHPMVLEGVALGCRNMNTRGSYALLRVLLELSDNATVLGLIKDILDEAEKLGAECGDDCAECAWASTGCAS